jgi:hypothetical protein
MDRRVKPGDDTVFEARATRAREQRDYHTVRNLNFF